jgi:NAD(P)-dependent dehydrogenase (short-subunit alcohol dehydrogenase family)
MKDQHMGLLENKIAVITGGTRGLGLAIAQAYIREGASVVVASRSVQAVTQAVDLLHAEGGQVSGLACDVADLAQVEALGDHAITAFGRFDIWVNNAGISPAYGPTAHIQPQAFIQATQTNILGTYHGSVVALRHFLPKHAGKLINIIGAGARGPVPMQNAYASSKAWIRNFTLALAQEYKNSGVSILAFSPGMMTTEMLTNVQVVAGYEHLLQSFPTIVRVIGKPPELAAPKAVWLASVATNGRTGLEVYLSNPVAILWGFLCDRIRRLAGQPDTLPQLNITPVPPAI